METQDMPFLGGFTIKAGNFDSAQGIVVSLISECIYAWCLFHYSSVAVYFFLNNRYISLYFPIDLVILVLLRCTEKLLDLFFFQNMQL